ncbi:MAG: M43 family zinc metalloprotease, partial [Bacteroidia bacterium]
MVKKFTSLFSILFILAFNSSLVAQFNNANQNSSQIEQQGRGCGTGMLPQQFETWLQEKMQSGPGKGQESSTQSYYTIPVVVHVVHNNEAVNSISANSGYNLNAAQIQDQINILNKDFNGLNADTSTIPSVFKPLLGKFKISFCLAVVNPTGGVMPEPGIDRINRVAKGWSAPPYSNTSYIDNTIKANSIWDPSRYFNIWVLNLGGTLLGYATFPNPGATGIQGLGGPYGSATTDGIVIGGNYFGSIGTGSTNAQYNKGRTATHEVGHWVGLRHVWGDSNCGNDFCNDTPTQQSSNFNCPSFPKISCSNGPNGEMFMNFMDYVNDNCMKLFTLDQMHRAQVIMANSVYRASLLTSTVCNLPSATNDLAISNIVSPTYSQVINCDNFIIPTIKVHNMGSNAITAATFTYNVDGVNTQTLNWVGNLAANTSTNITFPQISNLTNASHGFNVKVITVNAVADTYTINNYSNQLFKLTNGYDFTPVVTTPICSGDNATLTVTGSASGYTWNPGSIVGTSATVTPSSTFIYSVNASLGTCIKTKTVQVTVNPTPTLTANSTTICTGGTATLVAQGATTYSWSTTQTSSVIM